MLLRSHNSVMQLFCCFRRRPFFTNCPRKHVAVHWWVLKSKSPHNLLMLLSESIHQLVLFFSLPTSWNGNRVNRWARPCKLTDRWFQRYLPWLTPQGSAAPYGEMDLAVGVWVLVRSNRVGSAFPAYSHTNRHKWVPVLTSFEVLIELFSKQ